MEAAVSGAPARGGPAAAAATIAEAFRITSAERAQEVAIRTKDDAFTITWGELRRRADALAGGLHGLGLRRGDTLALMIGNRPEFHLCDIAAMMVGAAPFSIYSTYTAEQIAYLMGDAEARILICESQYLDRVLEARKSLPKLEHVIVVDGEGEGSFERTLLASEAGQLPSGLGPDDMAVLMFTSGTTGEPKGVMHTSNSLIACCKALSGRFGLDSSDVLLVASPVGHMTGYAAIVLL
ncbi:MAG TPA: AMP-binding protein, partial [Solirubrobacteraceae bacterium]